MAEKLPRVQRIVMPIIREALGPDVKVGTWVEDIDYRDFPIVNVRRLGGTRHQSRPELLNKPVIELTVYGTGSLAETEDLYDDALLALYMAKRHQKTTEFGYIHSVKETMGATQFDSPFQNTWRVQGLVQVGIRPPQSH